MQIIRTVVPEIKWRVRKFLEISYMEEAQIRWEIIQTSNERNYHHASCLYDPFSGVFSFPVYRTGYEIEYTFPN